MALSNSQYQSIIREYEKKQLEHKHLLEQRRRELYQALPALEALERQIIELSIHQVQKRLNAPEKADDSTYHTQLAQLRKQKEDLLAQSSFPADYLSPPYYCSNCKDTGFVNGKKCHCFQEATIALLYSDSHLGEILQKENFETFSLEYYSPQHMDSLTGHSSREIMTNNLRHCKAFADDFGQRYENLLLYGETGTGKTFLSHCITEALIRRASFVLCLSSQELFDMMVKHRRDSDDNTQTAHDQIFDCDLLIIDDLGTELPNNTITSQLFFCLNRRLTEQKPTIISTNLSLEELKDIYGTRIISRLISAYTFLRFVGDDIRHLKRLCHS